MTKSCKPRQMPVARHGTPGAGLRSVAPLAGLTRPEPAAESEPELSDPSDENANDAQTDPDVQAGEPGGEETSTDETRSDAETP